MGSRAEEGKCDTETLLRRALHNWYAVRESRWWWGARRSIHRKAIDGATEERMARQ